MYAKFHSLEKDKQERIINEALNEFARSGYDRASTNEIAKAAGIAKGSLFVYFDSKKGLFLFLLDYIGSAVSAIYDEMDWSETDLLKRIWNLGLIKLAFYQKHPHAFGFLKAAGLETATEVKAAIDKMGNATVEIASERLFRDADLTRFRGDIGIETAIDVINWTVMGLAQRQADRLDSSNEIGTEVLHEWQTYLAFLEQCFYDKKEK